MRISEVVSGSSNPVAQVSRCALFTYRQLLVTQRPVAESSYHRLLARLVSEQAVKSMKLIFRKGAKQVQVFEVNNMVVHHDVSVGIIVKIGILVPLDSQQYWKALAQVIKKIGNGNSLERIETPMV